MATRHHSKHHKIRDVNWRSLYIVWFLGEDDTFSSHCFFRPRLTGPSINRPVLTGKYIQLFSLKSTRYTVEKN